MRRMVRKGCNHGSRMSGELYAVYGQEVVSGLHGEVPMLGFRLGASAQIRIYCMRDT